MTFTGHLTPAQTLSRLGGSTSRVRVVAARVKGGRHYLYPWWEQAQGEGTLVIMLRGFLFLERAPTKGRDKQETFEYVQAEKHMHIRKLRACTHAGSSCAVKACTRSEACVRTWRATKCAHVSGFVHQKCMDNQKVIFMCMLVKN